MTEAENLTHNISATATSVHSNVTFPGGIHRQSCQVNMWVRWVVVNLGTTGTLLIQQVEPYSDGEAHMNLAPRQHTHTLSRKPTEATNPASDSHLYLRQMHPLLQLEQYNT